VGRDGQYEPFVKGPLCASVEGFSLHAGAWVGPRDRERQEKLCRYAAPDLLRRTFGIDVLVCPQCAGPRRVLAAIHDPAAIARVLGALGLTAAGADPAGCRAPPAAAGFDDADEGNAAE
jgi:hypothetical protein